MHLRGREAVAVSLSVALTIILIVVFVGLLKPYQRERLRVAIDPTQDPLGRGFSGAFQVRERFMPQWRMTGAVAAIAVAGGIPALVATRRRRHS
jgi:hypothetical protein